MWKLQEWQIATMLNEIVRFVATNCPIVIMFVVEFVDLDRLVLGVRPPGGIAVYSTQKASNIPIYIYPGN